MNALPCFAPGGVRVRTTSTAPSAGITVSLLRPLPIAAKLPFSAGMLAGNAAGGIHQRKPKLSIGTPQPALLRGVVLSAIQSPGTICRPCQRPRSR